MLTEMGGHGIGVVALIAGGGFVAAALAHRKHHLAQRTAALARGWVEVPDTAYRSMGRFAEGLRPLVLIALGFLALTIVMFYIAADLSDVLGPVGLAGVLVALAGYGTWFNTRITYRASALPRPAPAVATDPEPPADAGEPQDDLPAPPAAA